MKEMYFGLLAIGWRLWRPWSADHQERASSEAIASAVFVLWLASVPVAVWMVFGDAPGLLAGAATTLLWVLGLAYFYCIEFPMLMLRFAFIWVAGAQRWTGVEDGPETQQEREARYDRGDRIFEQLKASEALPPDYESPPRSDEDLPDYLARTVNHRPTMRPVVKIAGAILIVALIAGHQPFLAAFYAVPSLGWIAVEWLRRKLPQGQSA